MPERWEERLEKIDRLQPSADVEGRVGHVPTPDRSPSPGRKAVTIAAAFLVFIVAGSFVWRALSDVGTDQPVATPSPAAPTDGLMITCGADGAEVQSPAAVSDDGLHMAVRNLSGVDEVLIMGTDRALDMDLSQATRHTSEHLGTGSYMVGCFTDAEMPSGSTEDILSHPGFVPVEVVDPSGSFVDWSLACDGHEIRQPDGIDLYDEDVGNLPELDVVRSKLRGLQESDVVELAGYVGLWGNAEMPHTYRIVRAGQVVGTVELRLWNEPDWSHVGMLMPQFCESAGLSLAAESTP